MAERASREVGGFSSNWLFTRRAAEELFGETEKDGVAEDQTREHLFRAVEQCAIESCDTSRCFEF